MSSFIPSRKPLVILESPFAGEIEANIAYARRAVRHSITIMNESPFASHLLHTQEGILKDQNSAERALGIECGLQWYRVAERSVIYADRGMSRGMLQGWARARHFGLPISWRFIETPDHNGGRASYPPDYSYDPPEFLELLHKAGLA